ncbi:MAG: SDR family oxidoreductase [Lachnospiraceae bacterium]|nr:SDR family oxidoreductase [Lachnospiraceae bacterium]
MYIKNYEHKKTAVVTGGAGGLGKAIAIRLADAGFNIAIVDMNAEQGEIAKKEIEKHGPCMFVQFDITKCDECPKVFEQVYEKFNSVDVLINNAGISKHRGTTDTIGVPDWDLTLAINLKGLFFMAKAAAPFMEKSGGGSIVNTASIRSYLATGDRTLYAITKKAIRCVNAELAADFWRYGIRVNSISPGYVLTEMTKVHLDEPGWLDNQMNIILIDNMVLPEDIGEVVLFLASDESVALSGCDIPCEGGLNICRGKLPESGV